MLPAGKELNLATLVFEKRIDALVHGLPPYKRIVIEADAKLDDMLAATFVWHLVTHGGLPKGAAAFARYAAVLREGHRPGNFPLEDSLEGIAIAMRCRPTKPLTDPETGQQFLADWRRLADVLMKAAEQNANPFTTPLPKLVGQGPARAGLDAFRPVFSQERQVDVAAEFASEREFLKQDLAAYREDSRTVENGTSASREAQRTQRAYSWISRKVCCSSTGPAASARPR